MCEYDWTPGTVQLHGSGSVDLTNSSIFIVNLESTCTGLYKIVVYFVWYSLGCSESVLYEELELPTSS